jgi:hypothetical protein
MWALQSRAAGVSFGRTRLAFSDRFHTHINGHAGLREPFIVRCKPERHCHEVGRRSHKGHGTEVSRHLLMSRSDRSQPVIVRSHLRTIAGRYRRQWSTCRDGLPSPFIVIRPEFQR